jgi:hypothetical protein
MVISNHPRLLAFAALATVCACHAEVPVAVTTDVPMVYLLLTPDSLDGLFPELRAVVANIGGPGLVPIDYLTADRFTMRRKSDGIAFNWYAVPAMGIYAPSGGNYALAESASAAGLGRTDLAAGETYTLEIPVGDSVITGEATIPEHPQPRLVELTDGAQMVVWPAAGAAAGYQLHVISPEEYVPFTADTFYLLRGVFPVGPGSRIVLTAMDSNWARYFRDNTAKSAGLTGAYGVFGAMSRTTLILP